MASVGLSALHSDLGLLRVQGCTKIFFIYFSLSFVYFIYLFIYLYIGNPYRASRGGLSGELRCGPDSASLWIPWVDHRAVVGTWTESRFHATVSEKAGTSSILSSPFFNQPLWKCVQCTGFPGTPVMGAKCSLRSSLWFS